MRQINRENLHRLVSLSVLGLLLVSILSVPPGYSQTGGDNACVSKEWPHESSDLPPDPNIVFGRLANGVRYAMLHNGEPRQRVALMLAITAGSVNEREEERGLAHFLEHMAFNGSAHFKPGTLVNFFQSIGMSFGGDTNAFTSFDRTVYKLILPSSDRKVVDEGLVVMSDFARGLSLIEKEVEQERGVILSEMAARDSAGYRAQIAKMDFTMQGSLMPQRWPIGTKDVLEHADSNQLRRFYDAWYRPEHMILVMVGDFDVAAVKPLIEDHFSGLTAKGPYPQCPDYGVLTPRQVEGFYLHEKELGTTEVVIETGKNKDPQDDSLALQKENIQRLMVGRMINRRLDRLMEQASAPFSSASYGDGDVLDRYRFAGIRAVTDAERWKESLAAIDTVLRQVIEFGFEQDELDLVKKELVAELKDAVLTRDTRNSMELAQQLVDNLVTRRVTLSPEQEQELFRPLVEATRIEDLNSLTKSIWAEPSRFVEVIGTAKIDGDAPEKVILDEYQSLQKQAVQAPATKLASTFPYLTKKDHPVGPAAIERMDELGIVRFRFENGVIVNFKHTDFEENGVEIAVNFGAGRRGMPRPGLDMLASAVVNGSGTGTMKESELSEALAGSSISYGFRVGEESFSLRGHGLSGELERLFQVLQAMYQDPGFRPDIFEVTMKKFELMYQKMGSSIEGGMKLQVEPFLAGGAAGFGLPDWRHFSQLTLDDIKKWLLPAFHSRPLEISVVGDVPEEAVRDMVSRYFYQVEETVAEDSKPPTITFPVGGELDVDIDTSVDKALFTVAWLTDDFWDIARTRRLHVLAAVLEDRLRQVIREKLGATYSPSVQSGNSRIFPHYGLLNAAIITQLASVDLIRKATIEVVEAMVAQPLGDEEVERAKRPIVTSLKEAVRSNDYWLNSVLSLSSRHPEQLKWPLTMIDDFSSITPAQITELARSYLTPGRRAVAILRPQKR